MAFEEDVVGGCSASGWQMEGWQIAKYDAIANKTEKRRLSE
jgi:hypothetical protein